MRIPRFAVTATALLLVGCYVEEPPRYAHQGQTRCSSRQTRSCSSPVVVSCRYPSPPPGVRSPTPGIRPPGPGIRTPPPAVPTPSPAVGRRCFFRRARWVRVWQGWRRLPGRRICRRGGPLP